MSSSDWIIIPTMGEKLENVPNHQPVMHIYIYYGAGTLGHGGEQNNVDQIEAVVPC